MINISSCTVGPWNENSYLLEYNGESWLIDPGDEFSVLDDYFGKSKYNGLLCTHGHFDHIGAIDEFKKKYSLTCYIHSKDKNLVRQANLYRRLAGDTKIQKTPVFDNYLDDVEFIPIGDKKITIHHLPGHTKGSLGFVIDNSVFLGDVIIEGKIGRTDLPGGSKTALANSLKYIFDNFENYQIYPGHGEPFVLTAELIKKLERQI